MVTTSIGFDRQPVYSPDGRQILFSSNRSGNVDLWMVERATGELRQVTDDPAHDWDPAFSPDSRRLLEREAGGAAWLIAADDEDAAALAVNMVCIGDTVVMAACGERLEAAISKVGFNVIRSPLTSFGMSGGAAFCLTLRIDHRSDRLSPRVAA